MAKVQHDLVTFEASASLPNTSQVACDGVPPEAINKLRQSTSSSLANRQLEHCSLDCGTSYGLAIDGPSPDSTIIPQSMGTATSVTYGQASLLPALLCPGPSPVVDQYPRRAQPTMKPSVPLESSWVPSDTEAPDESTTHEDETPEGTVSVIHRELVLDKTAESNAFPFVLQSYSAWIGRVALDPAKLMHAARDFVCSHFDGGEQSRWIIVLLANIGRDIGSSELVDAWTHPMISALQTTVRWRLAVLKSYPNPAKYELAKALGSVLDAILIHFFVSPVSEGAILRQEVVPIFQQLCPEPPNTPIDLVSVLYHPLSCRAQFAVIDITFSLSLDTPTLSPYEVSLSALQSSTATGSAAIQDDGIVQWMYGVPNQILLILAKMISMRVEKLAPNLGEIASIERAIHSVQPFHGSSSERFIVIMRFIVQECWRQVALIYLYMAVCGDSSGTPRVRETLKRVMALLNGVKPGHLPDNFLALPLIIISPAAQRARDRETVRQRILGLETLRSNQGVTYIIEDYWARADAEGRQVIWSDVATSRRKLVGA